MLINQNNIRLFGTRNSGINRATESIIFLLRKLFKFVKFRKVKIEFCLLLKCEVDI